MPESVGFYVCPARLKCMLLSLSTYQTTTRDRQSDHLFLLLFCINVQVHSLSSTHRLTTHVGKYFFCIFFVHFKSFLQYNIRRQCVFIFSIHAITVYTCTPNEATYKKYKNMLIYVLLFSFSIITFSTILLSNIYQYTYAIFAPWFLA